MTKRRTAALLVAAASITLAGCGDGDIGVADLDADKIVEEVLEAMATAQSVQVTGEMEIDGTEPAVDMPLAVSDQKATAVVSEIGVRMLTCGSIG